MKRLLLAATLALSATAQDTYVRLIATAPGDTNAATMLDLSGNQLCQVISIVSEFQFAAIGAELSPGVRIGLTKAGDTILGPAKLGFGIQINGAGPYLPSSALLKITEVNVSPVPMAIQPAGFAVNAQMEWSGDLKTWFIGTNGPVDAAVTNRFYRVKLDLRTP